MTNDNLKKKYWITVSAEAIVTYDILVEATSKEEAYEVYVDTVSIPLNKPNAVCIEKWGTIMLEDDIVEDTNEII